MIPFRTSAISNARNIALLASLTLAAAPTTARADEAAHPLPPPAVDVAPSGSRVQTAVFAGGCFWGVQGVFEHVKGVTQAVSGYAGGALPNPTYGQVSSGATGHAESVSVTY